MITIRLKGGMGNQMFQYAFGRSISTKLNTDFQLDLSSLLDRSKGDFVYRDYDLDIFNVQPKFTTPPDLLRTMYRIKSSKLSKLVKQQATWGKSYVKEKHFHLVKEVIDHPTDNTLYDGWWQSGKYFDAVAHTIRKEFTFVDPIIAQSKALFEKIQQTNAICLNVRRTDFLKVSALNTTNLDYFLNAAKYMAQQVDQPHFYIFSDDIEWSAANIKLDHPTTVVRHEHKGRKFGNYLQLMIACKHYIIPNSSFAWWSTWLNPSKEKIVVAPKNWFHDSPFDTSDLVPQNWIRL